MYMKLYNEPMLTIVKQFIENYQKENAKSPSYRVIMHKFPKFFGSSISKVQNYVHQLQKRGWIKLNDGVIDIPFKLTNGEVKPALLVGECACGTPMTAIENIEGSYALPTELFGTSERIILRAKGYSMVEEGIKPGDLMFVRVQNYADAGDIVIARVNGDEATAKYYMVEKGKVFLRAANSSLNEDGTRVFPDIYPEGEWEIIGVVDNVLQKKK
jgi:repressor LexA